MKKSIAEAEAVALCMSAKHPQRKYYVLNKKQEKAIVHGIDWCANVALADGWELISVFKGGKKVAG